MSQQASRWMFILMLLISVTLAVPLLGCGDDDDDDDDNDTSVDDDTGDDDSSDDDTDDDDTADDDTADDDTADDDTADDDTADDDTPDDYIAPWPQSNIMPRDYNETPEAGPLRQKAEEYDLWHETWHQPDKGGNVHVYFADDTYSEVTQYHGAGDSCIWTGTYLGTQTARYWITDDEQARTNMINMVHTLDGYLHVNGRPGFISRYWGSQDDPHYYGGDEWCDNPDNDRCHHIEEGEFAGDFWIGGTSRDQYTGWFYGMTMAYDHLDDEDTLDIIRADVAEVLDELISTHWWIIDANGFPTDAAPNVLPPMRMAWLLDGYHITGEERFKEELQKCLKNSYRPAISLNTISFFNRYSSYFGNNLSHTNWFHLLRLGEVYFSEDDYNFLLKVFENQVHSFTRLSHNPWFTAIFIGAGDYDPDVPDDPYPAQIAEDLDEFIPPPSYDFHLDARDPLTYTLDPISVFLHDLQEQFPFLEEIFGGVEYQALDPFPVSLQCPGGFRFQWNPFRISECGSGNVLKVHSGHEYIAAYWLASYYKALSKDQ